MHVITRKVTQSALSMVLLQMHLLSILMDIGGYILGLVALFGAETLPFRVLFGFLALSMIGGSRGVRRWEDATIVGRADADAARFLGDPSKRGFICTCARFRWTPRSSRILRTRPSIPISQRPSISSRCLSGLFEDEVVL